MYRRWISPVASLVRSTSTSRLIRLRFIGTKTHNAHSIFSVSHRVLIQWLWAKPRFSVRRRKRMNLRENPARQGRIFIACFNARFAPRSKFALTLKSRAARSRSARWRSILPRKSLATWRGARFSFSAQARQANVRRARWSRAVLPICA